MYIPEFWAGVLCTLGVQFVLIMIFIIIASHNSRKDDRK